MHLELQDKAEVLELCKALPLELNMVVPCLGSQGLGMGLQGKLDFEAEERLLGLERQDMLCYRQEDRLGLEGPLGEVDLGWATWFSL